jgi:hypothetical protein
LQFELESNFTATRSCSHRHTCQRRFSPSFPLSHPTGPAAAFIASAPLTVPDPPPYRTPHHAAHRRGPHPPLLSTSCPCSPLHLAYAPAQWSRRVPLLHLFLSSPLPLQLSASLPSPHFDPPIRPTTGAGAPLPSPLLDKAATA